MIWMAPNALSFSMRHMHTDNAVMLLMGKHMLEKGEFPIFYYGQDYFGSLSAVVHAGVFFVLGGIPPWSIHAAPLLFFLGFCLLLYRLTHDTLGPTVALWALAWNIATPVHLAEYAVMPNGCYVESLTMGTLLLWLAVRLVMARGTRWQPGYYALLGFVGGVGWWTSPLVVYQIVASGIYVVMREGMAAVLKGALLSLPTFFLGAAPFFYFHAVDPYSTVLSLGDGFALANIPTGLSLLVTERLPEYLDWTLFQSKLPFTYGLAAVVMAGHAGLPVVPGKSFRAQHPLKSAPSSRSSSSSSSSSSPRASTSSGPLPGTCSRSPPSSPWPWPSAWCMPLAHGGWSRGRVARHCSCFMDGRPPHGCGMTRLMPNPSHEAT
jgi:hypothetical protein